MHGGGVGFASLCDCRTLFEGYNQHLYNEAGGVRGLVRKLVPVVKCGEGSADKLDADVQHKAASCEGDIIPEVKDVHLHSHRHRHSTFRSALELPDNQSLCLVAGYSQHWNGLQNGCSRRASSLLYPVRVVPNEQTQLVTVTAPQEPKLFMIPQHGQVLARAVLRVYVW